MKHLLPSVSSAVARVGQLLLLAALSHLALGAEADPTIVAFVLIGSLSQLADSGGLAYLLVHHEAARDRRAVIAVLTLQTATVGGAVTVGVLLAAFSIGVHSPDLLLLLLALGLAQLVDGLARIARSYALIESRPIAFSIPELISTCGRLVVIGLAWYLGSVLTLAWVLLPALFAFGLSWRMLTKTAVRSAFRVSYRAVLDFGISGLSTTFAAQAPLIVASILLPAQIVAPFSMAYRLAQASEFLPATLAQQSLPRLVAAKRSITSFALFFLALGGISAIIIWAFRDLIGLIMAFPEGTVALLAIVLLCLPFRFMNHLLGSALFARGLTRQKTIASISLGVIAAVAVATASLFGASIVLITIVAAAMELLQSTAFLLVLRTHRDKQSDAERTAGA